MYIALLICVLVYCVLNTDYNGITQIAALYVSRQMKSMRPDLKRNSGNKGNTKIQETTTV